MKKTLVYLLLCLPLLAHSITAKSYVVIDENGQIIAQENIDAKRPIASITKLFTGAKNVDLPSDETITITDEDVRRGKMKSTPLRPGKSYTREKLLELSLINSDNVAAIALGRTSKTELHLPPNTQYVEASGLDSDNRSTALEIATFARSLLSTKIAPISVQPFVRVDGVVRKNTNPLIGAPGWTFYLTKTGYTNPAGGCLVVVTKIKNKAMTVAILGSANVHQRWRDLAEIRHRLGDDQFLWPQQKSNVKHATRKKRK